MKTGKTEADAAGLPVLQRDVQRLLGRCIILLQSYETLLKMLVAHSNVTGSADTISSAIEARSRKTARMTLGGLVSEFVQDFLMHEDPQEQDDSNHSSAARHAPNAGPDVMTWRMGTLVSEDECNRLGADLRELVALRNDLVHHFTQKFDVTSAQGCRDAQAHLIDSFERIAGNYNWLKDVVCEAQRVRDVFLHSFSDQVVGAPIDPCTSGAPAPKDQR